MAKHALCALLCDISMFEFIKFYGIAAWDAAATEVNWRKDKLLCKLVKVSAAQYLPWK